MRDRQWVNEERTVLASLWPDGTLTVATREAAGHVWGPPKYLREESLTSYPPLIDQPDVLLGSPGAKQEEGT